jgi:hypothetical protein
MTRTIITPSDLSQRTREILDRVQQGELAAGTSSTGGRARFRHRAGLRLRQHYRGDP